MKSLKKVALFLIVWPGVAMAFTCPDFVQKYGKRTPGGNYHVLLNHVPGGYSGCQKYGWVNNNLQMQKVCQIKCTVGRSILDEVTRQNERDYRQVERQRRKRQSKKCAAVCIKDNKRCSYTVEFDRKSGSCSEWSEKERVIAFCGKYYPQANRFMVGQEAKVSSFWQNGYCSENNALIKQDPEDTCNLRNGRTGIWVEDKQGYSVCTPRSKVGLNVLMREFKRLLMKNTE